ncbi:MAG: YqaJ viral recombinase family protein [Chryseobacterium sp.]|nr:YqaJ viral recombinase family protein [Chryseobacterium sp.]
MSIIFSSYFKASKYKALVCLLILHATFHLLNLSKPHLRMWFFYAQNLKKYPRNTYMQSITSLTLSPHLNRSTQPFIAPKLFSAKRLVNTKHMSQAEWLEVRRQGIGSSDCAAACGLNPYMSMLELWMIKTGRIQQNIEDESEGHAPLYWGKRLEPLVAEYYSMHTNNKVRRVNAVLQHPEADKYFMLANLDYSVVGSDEVQVLECKTAGEYGAKLWRDGVPLGKIAIKRSSIILIIRFKKK